MKQRRTEGGYMSYSLKSLMGLHRGLYRGVVLGLSRGILGV